MSSGTENYESFIGSSYVAPIVHLYERLESGPSRPPKEVQSSPWQYGFSASIIALTILYLESLLNVSKYLSGSDEREVRAYFKNKMPNSAFRDEIIELFALRDVIAHNHVWKGQYNSDHMTWTSGPSLLPGYGDRAFRRVVNMNTRLTKKLGLNIVPTRLSLEDVSLVIKTTASILRELRDWHIVNKRGVFVRGAFGSARYRGKYVSFLEFADVL